MGLRPLSSTEESNREYYRDAGGREDDRDLLVKRRDHCKQMKSVGLQVGLEAGTREEQQQGRCRRNQTKKDEEAEDEQEERKRSQTSRPRTPGALLGLEEEEEEEMYASRKSD